MTASISSVPLGVACVFPAPRTDRPWYDRVIEAQPDDEVLVLAVGPQFRYTIPSFDVLELRQIKVKGYTSEGEEKRL